jgi:hypothetical protein
LVDAPPNPEEVSGQWQSASLPVAIQPATAAHPVSSKAGRHRSTENSPKKRTQLPLFHATDQTSPRNFSDDRGVVQVTRTVISEELMDHDLRLTRKDGSIRYFHIYGRPAPKDGETITVPIDGKFVKASVKGAPDEPETAIAVDAEAEEI